MEYRKAREDFTEEAMIELDIKNKEWTFQVDKWKKLEHLYQCYLQIGGQTNGVVGRIFALHVADLSLILSISCISQSQK